MSSRLSLAIADGFLALPDGVGAFNCDADTAWDGLGAVEQRFFPEYTRLEQRGLAVAPVLDTDLPAAVIFCHRAKPATLDMIARASKRVPDGGLIAVEGAKTDGIESVLKAVRARVSEVDAFSKAHGKLIWWRNTGDFSDWLAMPQKVDGFWTTAGVFSDGAVDKGSRLLAEHLPQMAGNGVDLGAGWGFLAQAALGPKVKSLDLLEADFHAAEMARRNVVDPRAQVIWGDVSAHKGRYDFVISNPPFHLSRTPDAALGQAFIAKAAQLLTAKGHFWMVANRQLPYEAALDENFHNVEIKAQTGGFKVIFARKPKTTRG